MLVEIAIGDAYGAGFEFSSIKKIEKYNNLTSYHTHELGMPAGNYTDDTQMSLAIAELLIEKKEWNAINIANKFVECFKRDERLGYSKGFYNLLESVNNGKELLQRIEAISTRNGAAMRSAPLGIIRDIDMLLHMAKIQAMITHNTKIGIVSAQAVALMSHFFIYKIDSKDQLTNFVSENTKYQWDSSWNQPVKCCGEETVNALLTILESTSSLSEILIRSVDFSGDVDTVASIALGVASVCSEYDKDLPLFLSNNLENNKYGMDYLLMVGKELLELKENEIR